MKTITIGSFKGGTGKTTLTAVLGAALANRGIKTSIIELETSTKPLARFEAARSFADLPTSSVAELALSGGTPDIRDWQLMLSRQIEQARVRGCQLTIIDTGSVWKPEVIAAHLLADLVLTTVTESPIDLYQFMPGEGPNMQSIHPYAELINLVRRNAEKSERASFEWTLCINRRSHLRTRVGDSVFHRLKDFTQAADVSLMDGLTDRVAYRNMMETGVTPLDDVAGEPVARSALAARTEVARLVGSIMARLKPAVETPAYEFA